MKIIGITGGIGSGKSTVSNIIKKYGFKVIDADNLSRKVIDENDQNGVLEKLSSNFGTEIFNEGKLDRKKLASVAFSNDEEKNKLDRIMLPEIINLVKIYIEEYGKNGEKLIFLDAALLFETKLSDICDENWLVFADEELRIQRVRQRDAVSEKEVKMRMRFQMPEDEKIKLSDFILKNDSNIESLENRIKNKLEEMKFYE